MAHNDHEIQDEQSQSTYFAFDAWSLKYISLLRVKRNWMNPVGPFPVGQSTALKAISHNPLPLCGGRRAKSPAGVKHNRTQPIFSRDFTTGFRVK